MPYFIKDNAQYIDLPFAVNVYSNNEKKFTRAHRTKGPMEFAVDNFFKVKYPDIPTTEIAAIYHYTRGDVSAYRQLNNQLRKGNLDGFNKAFSELLSLGLSKMPVCSNDTKLYRTMVLSPKKFNQFMTELKSGVATFSGFTSTSTERSIALDRFNHMNIKKNQVKIMLEIQGNNGRIISDMSQFGGIKCSLPNQKEVLFDKGSKFSLVSTIVNNECVVLKLKEV